MSNFFNDLKQLVSVPTQFPNESNTEMLEIEAKKGLIVKIAEMELAEIERMLKDAYAVVGEFLVLILIVVIFGLSILAKPCTYPA